MIAGLLLEYRLCPDCIGRKLGSNAAAVQAYLVVIARRVQLQSLDDRCDVCDSPGDVVTLAMSDA